MKDPRDKVLKALLKIESGDDVHVFQLSRRQLSIILLALFNQVTAMGADAPADLKFLFNRLSDLDK